MESIRAIALSFCATVIVTAIFFFILPDEKFRGVLKFSVSLFFLCGLVAPFVQGDLSFSFELPAAAQENPNEQTTEAAYTYFVQLVETNIEQSLYTAAEQAGCEAQQIKVQVHIEEDGCIYIDQIIAVAKEPQNERTLFECIRTHTGVSPENSFT